ncbi:acyl-CoA dehydrogenase/oxidase [Gautieria morchelliformis]|nr:acyl-CoA dehydrogenase/oxidase [Gautieria morchelliformis]
MSRQLRQVSRGEVAKHNKPGDLWVVIDSRVFDISKFAALHPGGESVLFDVEVAGADATETFFGLHRYEVLEKPSYARLQIGVVEGESPKVTGRGTGELSAIPYGEPTWLSPGFHSPYYKESHRKFQAVMRKFVDDILYPDAQAREEDGKRPSQSVIDAMAAVNLHAMRLGPGKHLKGKTLFDGLVSPEEFDYFHELIITQELTGTGSRGYGDALNGGTVIGLPPVLNFGSPELQAKIVPDVFAGKKFICLAISEAFAGSDVMGLRTTATLSEDGKHYIVNGTKKWITNGTFSDYFTVGCRTESGFSVLLIERGEGVETKPIKTSYSATAGTAYITFDNVKVPVENMLGPDGGGIFVINFNHERWVMCCASIRSHRSVVEECMTWASQRKVFGKPLNSQAVVRSKLAAMIARVESLQAWLENVTYQMNNMSYKQQASKLAGQIAFLKMAATQAAQETARDAVQLFGGRGITKTGMGRFIEHYHRTITFDSLLGGAEDVLGDLGVRQAMRAMPKNVRL